MGISISVLILVLPKKHKMVPVSIRGSRPSFPYYILQEQSFADVPGKSYFEEF